MDDFEWDEAKSERTRRARGFGFAYAARIFEGPVRESDDSRHDYGERRIRALGCIDENIVLVVYTWRGGVRRIISARPAGRKERDGYRAVYA
jgi:hypothetical protein